MMQLEVTTDFEKRSLKFKPGFPTAAKLETVELVIRNPDGKIKTAGLSFIIYSARCGGRKLAVCDALSGTGTITGTLNLCTDRMVSEFYHLPLGTRRSFHAVLWSEADQWMIGAGRICIANNPGADSLNPAPLPANRYPTFEEVEEMIRNGGGLGEPAVRRVNGTAPDNSGNVLITVPGDVSELEDRTGLTLTVQQKNALATLGATYAVKNHTHSEYALKSELPDISGFVTADRLNLYQLKANAFSGKYADLTGKPATFPPGTHTHVIADVNGLADELNRKLTVPAGGNAGQFLMKTVSGCGWSSIDLASYITITQARNEFAAKTHEHSQYALASALQDYAAKVHTHIIGDVTGLQDALDGKADTGHNHDSAYAPKEETATALNSKLTIPAGGTAGQVIGKTSDGYGWITVSGGASSWDEITGKPSTFTPAAHSHSVAEVTGLQTALDGKSAAGHTHTTAEVAGLAAALSGKVSSVNGATPDSSGAVTIPEATSGAAGLMSAADKTKLDGLDATGSSGDMLKSVYDTNDDGIVDHAATADTVGATTAAQVADAVGKAHTHANQTTLDKLAEVDGKLTYDGTEIGGGSDVDESRLLPNPATVSANLAGHPVVFDVQEQGGAGDANTLLLMHFDDDTVDYSPNAYSATKTGDVAFQTGKFGKCLKFAAASGGSYLQIPNAPVFNLASLSAWTFDVLVYLTQTPGYNAVLVKRNASSPVSYQFCFSSGTRKPQLYTGSAYVATGEVPLNTWTHVAFTYLNGTLKIWIGGQLDSTFTNVSLTDYDLPVKIGYHYSSTTEQFIGLLDELRLSSCDRTADQNDPMYSADGTSFTPPAKPYGVTSNRFKVSESGVVTAPADPADGDIPCYSNEPPEGVNYNDANTVLLLQGSSNNTAAASTSDRLNGIVTGSFPTQADGSILVNGSDNYITCNNADTRRVFGGEFTIEMYIKTAQFTSTGTRQDTNWYKLSGYGNAQVVNISDFYASTAGTYGIWPYGLLSGETFPKNAQNGVYQHLAIDVYMVGSTRKFTMYLNGIAYYTGTYWSSPADWDDSYSAAVKIFGDDSTHLQNASVMSLRVSNIARYKGVSFDPPADGKYLNPPAGYWGKLSKNEIVKTDSNRLLPEGVTDGDIPCFDATATTGGGNDSTTKLLLQPATSNNQIVDQAAGNAAPVTLQNTGVTVDDAGAMVFDGNSYLALAASALPAGFLDGTDDWTLDLIYNVSSKSTQCLFGRGTSPRMDFLLQSSGALEIGGGPSLGGNWPFNTDVRLTFELYKDGSSWKYTAFRDGSVVTSGTWSSANWRSVALWIGWDGDTDSRKISGKIKALRLTAGASHKGVAFTPDELPWTQAQVVGEWGKLNKSALALKTDLADKADKTALLGKADKSQLAAYQPLLPVEKQLPAAVNDDEVIMSKITTSTVPGANDETVKFLLQPATSNNQVVDSAAGNETPLTFTNNGVTADSDGIMTFSPTQYAVIPASTVTEGLIDILLNIPTVPNDNVEYVLFGNGPDNNSGGDGFYVYLYAGKLYLCSGSRKVAFLGSYTANTWVNITLGYAGPTANWDNNIGYWLNGAGHTANWNTTDYIYSYHPFGHDFYLGKTDQSSTGLTWKAKVVRLRNTVTAIPWYSYNDTTTITVDDYPYQETVQQTKKSWGRSTIAQLEAKMSVATTLEDGLMAAADKTALATLEANYLNKHAGFSDADMNAATDLGMFWGSFSANAPASGSAYYALQNAPYGTVSGVVQMACQVAANKLFYRYFDKQNATGNWQRLLTHIDIVEYIARPGYFKLPNGLFVQWGAASNITADGTTPVVFQIAFPHLMLTGYATAVSGGASASGVVISVSGISTTGMNLITKNHPGGDKDINIHWLAIGY